MSFELALLLAFGLPLAVGALVLWLDRRRARRIKMPRILNPGAGIPVDELTTDPTCTFVADPKIEWHIQHNVSETP